MVPPQARDPQSIRRAIEAVWRIEAATIVAGLARILHDVEPAEELAQDALVAALDTWPRTGIPDRPGAWLMTTAKRKAIDLLRRNRRLRAKLDVLGRDQLRAESEPDPGNADELLRLLFATCHPGLPSESRGALTLRLVAGMTTPEIARAYLVTESTVGQRIVRAKRTLTKLAAGFPELSGDEIAARSGSVLETIYLLFNEGYSAAGGDAWMRPGLCAEALRLGRALVELAPREAEAHGLLALMELHASRLGARTDPSGRPVLLPDQDRSRWDLLLVGRGLAALERAESLAAPRGPYMCIPGQACHPFRSKVATRSG